MIKDIVVNLSVREDEKSIGDYAVSIASALEAHIAGIAFIYDPNFPVSSGSAYISVEVIDAVRHDHEVAAKVAIDRFVKATSRAGVSAEPLTLTTSFDDAGDQFGRIARRFDLAIVGQAKPEPSAPKKRLPKAPYSIPAGR